MSNTYYTCPCCGYQTFTEWPGSYQICHVCFWEDDPVQILDPWFPGGANQPPLIEAQANYERYGAMEDRFIDDVSGVQPTDERDPRWRRVIQDDRAYVRVPRDLSREEHADLDTWYYWRRPSAEQAVDRNSRLSTSSHLHPMPHTLCPTPYAPHPTPQRHLKP